MKISSTPSFRSIKEITQEIPYRFLLQSQRILGISKVQFHLLAGGVITLSAYGIYRFKKSYYPISLDLVHLEEIEDCRFMDRLPLNASLMSTSQLETFNERKDIFAFVEREGRLGFRIDASHWNERSLNVLLRKLHERFPHLCSLHLNHWEGFSTENISLIARFSRLYTLKIQNSVQLNDVILRKVLVKTTPMVKKIRTHELRRLDIQNCPNVSRGLLKEISSAFVILSENHKEIFSNIKELQLAFQEDIEVVFIRFLHLLARNHQIVYFFNRENSATCLKIDCLYEKTSFLEGEKSKETVYALAEELREELNPTRLSQDVRKSILSELEEIVLQLEEKPEGKVLDFPFSFPIQRILLCDDLLSYFLALFQAVGANLSELCLRGQFITGSSLVKGQGLPVERIDLSSLPSFECRNLRALLGYGFLKELNLSYTGVTDDAMIRSISQLEKLVSLDLSSTAVSAAALLPSISALIFRRLEVLFLLNSDQIKALSLRSLAQIGSINNTKPLILVHGTQEEAELYLSATRSLDDRLKRYLQKIQSSSPIVSIWFDRGSSLNTQTVEELYALCPDLRHLIVPKDALQENALLQIFNYWNLETLYICDFFKVFLERRRGDGICLKIEYTKKDSLFSFTNEIFSVFSSLYSVHLKSFFIKENLANLAECCREKQVHILCIEDENLNEDDFALVTQEITAEFCSFILNCEELDLTATSITSEFFDETRWPARETMPASSARVYLKNRAGERVERKFH